MGVKADLFEPSSDREDAWRLVGMGPSDRLDRVCRDLRRWRWGSAETQKRRGVVGFGRNGISTLRTLKNKMNLFTPVKIEELCSRLGAKVRSVCLVLLALATLLPGERVQAGLIVYIDDMSTLGIDVVIADGKKANETIDWITSDKELVSLKTTLSDSDVTAADGMVGLSTEKDGGTWALLKSFLPNFTFDPGFVAAETTDATTGVAGLAMKLEVKAEKMPETNAGKLQIWATRTHKSLLETGMLSVEASGQASETMRESQIWFTGALDPQGNEFATSTSVAGSPTFGSVHQALASYEFSKKLAVSIRSSSLMSLTGGLSMSLMSGDAFSSNFQVNAVVPEPASILVWSLAAGALVLWRRRGAQVVVE